MTPSARPGPPSGLQPPELEHYLHRLAPPSEPVLAEMEAAAAERGFPIVGPLVGRLLFVLARAIRAESVFEIGSGFGYSGLWFAKALEPHGRVIMTERDPGNVAAARGYFDRAGLLDRAVLEPGDGLEVLARYPGPFDIVFADHDKVRYPESLGLALPRLRRGGLLITDNVLREGNVARPDPDPGTAAVMEYNRMLMASGELVASILPLRDGVAVAVKL